MLSEQNWGVVEDAGTDDERLVATEENYLEAQAYVSKVYGTEAEERGVDIVRMVGSSWTTEY